MFIGKTISLQLNTENIQDDFLEEVVWPHQANCSPQPLSTPASDGEVKYFRGNEFRCSFIDLSILSNVIYLPRDNTSHFLNALK